MYFRTNRLHGLISLILLTGRCAIVEFTLTERKQIATHSLTQTRAHTRTHTRAGGERETERERERERERKREKERDKSVTENRERVSF